MDIIDGKCDTCPINFNHPYCSASCPKKDANGYNHATMENKAELQMTQERTSSANAHPTMKIKIEHDGDIANF